MPDRSATAKGKPGRRPGADREAVRQALLGAARRCFASKPFAAVSVRELAAAARVNPAMIHYYFDSKAGLYLALFEEAVGPVLAGLAAAEDTGEGLEDVMARFMRTLAQHPWIPPLLLRDIYTGDSPVRALFIERFAGRAGPLLVRLVERGQAEGRFRRDAEPRLAAVSVLGMCLFPFLAARVASEVLELAFDPASVEALVQHNLRLLREGLQP